MDTKKLLEYKQYLLEKGKDPKQVDAYVKYLSEKYSIPLEDNAPFNAKESISQDLAPTSNVEYENIPVVNELSGNENETTTNPLKAAARLGWNAINEPVETARQLVKGGKSAVLSAQKFAQPAADFGAAALRKITEDKSMEELYAEEKAKSDAEVNEDKYAAGVGRFASPLNKLTNPVVAAQMQGLGESGINFGKTADAAGDILQGNLETGFHTLADQSQEAVKSVALPSAFVGTASGVFGKMLDKNTVDATKEEVVDRISKATKIDKDLLRDVFDNPQKYETTGKGLQIKNQINDALKANDLDSIENLSDKFYRKLIKSEQSLKSIASGESEQAKKALSTSQNRINISEDAEGLKPIIKELGDSISDQDRLASKSLSNTQERLANVGENVDLPEYRNRISQIQTDAFKKDPKVGEFLDPASAQKRQLQRQMLDKLEKNAPEEYLPHIQKSRQASEVLDKISDEFSTYDRTVSAAKRGFNPAEQDIINKIEETVPGDGYSGIIDDLNFSREVPKDKESFINKLTNGTTDENFAAQEFLIKLRDKTGVDLTDSIDNLRNSKIVQNTKMNTNSGKFEIGVEHLAEGVARVINPIPGLGPVIGDAVKKLMKTDSRSAYEFVVDAKNMQNNPEFTTKWLLKLSEYVENPATRALIRQKAVEYKLKEEVKNERQ